MDPPALSQQPHTATLVQLTVEAGYPDPLARHDRDAVAAALPRELRPHLRSLRRVRGFVLEGVGRAAAERAAAEVLADPVTERWSLDDVPGGLASDETVVTVLRRSGVMDPAQASCVRALAAVGIEATGVRTLTRYVVAWDGDPDALRDAIGRALANEVVEEIVLGAELDVHLPHPEGYRFRLEHVPLDSASDDELETISRERTLSLTLLEMQAVQQFFREAGRDPTDVELETLAQTWSEHCKHKTLAGAVHFRGPGGEVRTYTNLLKETVFEATRRLDRADCLSVFVDNAGVIEFDDEYGVCMKVETHNHPSAIEPYGGAGTGIGGVVRDILGTGKGARPFLNTDVFCFAPPDLGDADVPAGSLHPRRVMHGVVSGVRDYGNRMGIPTASGGLFFDPRYVGNPIVYCGTLGLLPKQYVDKRARPGDVIVAVGGRTGRDGIHGATFSSVELHEESESVSAGAVQIGNPIEEKRVLDALLVARDEDLLEAVTDCGAGGFSSAVGEMGEETGAVVYLERAPLKYDGLTYSEIWISEAQERMVLAVAPENVARVREIFEAEDVEVTELGEFTGDGRLRLFYEGDLVGDLPMDFVHDGLPRVSREAVWETQPAPPVDWSAHEPRDDLGPDLHAILGAWNVCSREWVIRQYDHEVQGGSAVGPLVGPYGVGPGDATVVTPRLGLARGVAVASGMNPRLGDLDPYQMALHAVDEALRNLVAVGVDASRAALLDNFSWGNTSKPDRLGSIVLASEGLRDAALAYGTPFVSGKDSLNNEYQVGGRTIAIPPTLLVSAFAVIDDVRRTVTMELKAAGSSLFVVGQTRPELGGSHLALVREWSDGRVPEVRPAESVPTFAALHDAIASGAVLSCHDCNEGGVATALAEMALAGDLGADVGLVHVPYEGDHVRDEILLFAETPGRFVVEVADDALAAFEQRLSDVPHARIGRVTADKRLRIRGLRESTVVDEALDALRESFTAPLRDGARAGAVTSEEAR